MISASTPSGYCHCGCGEKTSLAKYSRKSRGWVKGEPVRFIRGHIFHINHRGNGGGHNRKTYTIEEHGFKTACWIWEGSKTDKGYARAMFNGHVRRMHRVFYENRYGPVPDGLQLDHLCRVRHCVNPDHLDLATNAENVQRGDRAKLTAFQVAQMRRLHQAGHSRAALAEAYGVSESNTKKIIKRLTWKEVA